MTAEQSIRSAMFNQGAPMSAVEIHSQVYQGSHLMPPPVAETQATLDAMEREGRVMRTGSARWGFAYWLQPLEGFDR